MSEFKAGASRMVAQQCVQADIKGNIKAPHHRPFCDVNLPVTGGLPSQGAINMKVFPFMLT